jgi:hypothetical protein
MPGRRRTSFVGYLSVSGIMWEGETEHALRRLGFTSGEFPYRDNLQAVMVATKPGGSTLA